MRTQFFQEPLSYARILQIEAMHGYLYAVDRLKTLAKDEPEAAFRLALVYINKNDRLNACHYFQKTVDLEQTSKDQKYSTIINMKYFTYLRTYERYKPACVQR